MRRIAEMSTISEPSSSYLYEKDVYNPEEDTDGEDDGSGEGSQGGTSGEVGSSDGVTDGFEIADFMQDIQDIIRIE